MGEGPSRGVGRLTGLRGYGQGVSSDTDLPSDVVPGASDDDVPGAVEPPPEHVPELREELAREAATIEAQIHELEDDEGDLSRDPNLADRGQVAAEQGENLALANDLREQLDEIEAALGRLDQGTYGLCEVCSQPIADDRLDAMPATRFCIEHAG